MCRKTTPRITFAAQGVRTVQVNKVTLALGHAIPKLGLAYHGLMS